MIKLGMPSRSAPVVINDELSRQHTCRRGQGVWAGNAAVMRANAVRNAGNAHQPLHHVWLSLSSTMSLSKLSRRADPARQSGSVN